MYTLNIKKKGRKIIYPSTNPISPRFKFVKEDKKRDVRSRFEINLFLQKIFWNGELIPFFIIINPKLQSIKEKYYTSNVYIIIHLM